MIVSGAGSSIINTTITSGSDSDTFAGGAATVTVGNGGTVSDSTVTGGNASDTAAGGAAVLSATGAGSSISNSHAIGGDAGIGNGRHGRCRWCGLDHRYEWGFRYEHGGHCKCRR